MNISTRKLNLVVATAVLMCSSGCLHERFVPADQLAASQLRAQDLYAENQALLSANAQASQVMAGLDAERQMLAQQLGQSESQLATSNARIDNLLTERSQLKDRYGDLLRNGDPLLTGGGGAAIPGFEYDPVTGLSRFPETVLFDLGSAELRPEAIPILKSFASTVQSGAAQNLRIVIVGHSDDQNIVRPATALKHPTNWHLSTDRADSVVVQLARLGVTEERMAAMGYSKFQPLEASTSEPARRRNRRVEMYVVPDVGGLAQWDPARSLR